MHQCKSINLYLSACKKLCFTEARLRFIYVEEVKKKYSRLRFIYVEEVKKKHSFLIVIIFSFFLVSYMIGDFSRICAK